MLVASTSLQSRLVQLSIVAICLTVFWYLRPHSISIAQNLGGANNALPFSKPSITVLQKAVHTIDNLVVKAHNDFIALKAKRTKNVHDAANAYRRRRGRQPPPNFDLWFKYAQSQNAIIIEDFFDRIYHDLEPFWGVSPKQIREQAHDFIHRISVRNGVAKSRTDIEERVWINLWQDMVQSVAPYLPDVDIPINVMDESRMVVPWEEIDSYMTRANASREIIPERALKTTYQSLAELDARPPPHFDPAFITTGPLWNMAVAGCHPLSEARHAIPEVDFTKPPPLMSNAPSMSYQGYVSNWTVAKSACDHPSFQGLHGTFVEPVSISTTRKFFPLFGGSKLSMNNEILLPPAMYWTDDPFYSGGKGHGLSWGRKQDKLTWRGAASGGRNRQENWTRFQRHRFVNMLNATSVRHFEQFPLQRLPNFDLPNNGSYDLAVQYYGAGETAFSDWVSTWADAAVVHLLCFPSNETPYCPYTDAWFSIAEEMPMQEQYNSKYLPDIDGNSFSGRYRGFLGSTSLPIKATIYDEWHDSRLLPWKHFVPMDNTFVDIFGIMEYFIGNKLLGLEGRDAVAKIIAEDGKDWAAKVLRKEDMSIYVLRLLLEYARLCDDDRERMGWSENAT